MQTIAVPRPGNVGQVATKQVDTDSYRTLVWRWPMGSTAPQWAVHYSTTPDWIHCPVGGKNDLFTYSEQEARKAYDAK